MTARNVRLVVLAVALLALGVVLLVLARGPGSDGARRTATGPGAATVPGRGQPPRGSAPTVTPRGRATDDGLAEAPGDRDAGLARATRTHVMDDGTVVRDHRRGGGPPPVATTPLPPGQRTMSSAITAQVYQQLAPRVAACTSKVPAAARGAEPFVYVNLTVRVADGALTATDSLPVAHDVEDGAAAALTACVRAGLADLRVDAPGEPDHEGYVLQYPMRVR